MGERHGGDIDELAEVFARGRERMEFARPMGPSGWGVPLGLVALFATREDLDSTLVEMEVRYCGRTCRDATPRTFLCRRHFGRRYVGDLGTM